MWLLIAVIGGAAALLIVVGGSGDLIELVRQRLAKIERATETQLRAAAIYDLTSRRVVQLGALAGFVGLVIGFALSRSVLVALMAAAVALTVPRTWLARQRQQRLVRMEEQLPDAIDNLVSSVRAGLSLPQAIEETSRASSPPLAEEFGQIYREHQLGVRLPDAIDAARERIGGRAFPMVAAALLVSLDKGGNLPEALQKISESLKEIWRLEQKLLTASAEARKAMRVIAWMPVGIALMVMMLQPDLAMTLTGTGLGLVILFVVAVLYAVGLLWLRRLIVADV